MKSKKIPFRLIPYSQLSAPAAKPAAGYGADALDAAFARGVERGRAAWLVGFILGAMSGASLVLALLGLS